MTTIAYKDGLLVGDKLAYGGKYEPSPGLKTKIHRISSGPMQGWLCGISTNCVGGDKVLLAWIERGAPFGRDGEVFPDRFTVLLVDPLGRLHLAYDAVCLSGPIESEFYAIGTGAPYALGAMAVGRCAIEAVHAAARFDPHTGGHVDRLQLTPSTST